MIWRLQCDQMHENRIAKINIVTSSQKLDIAVFIQKWKLLERAQKVIKYLGWYCKKIICQKLLKPAQSGHTVCRPRTEQALAKLI